MLAVRELTPAPPQENEEAGPIISLEAQEAGGAIKKEGRMRWLIDVDDWWSANEQWTIYLFNQRLIEAPTVRSIIDLQKSAFAAVASVTVTLSLFHSREQNRASVVGRCELQQPTEKTIQQSKNHKFGWWYWHWKIAMLSAFSLFVSILDSLFEFQSIKLSLSPSVQHTSLGRRLIFSRESDTIDPSKKMSPSMACRS